MKNQTVTISSIDWAHWQPDLLTTLVFIRQQQQVLLIHKKTGLGAGKILGPGGKFEPFETPLACAIRETEEELEITPHDLQPMAELFFSRFGAPPKFKVYVYVTDHFHGHANRDGAKQPRFGVQYRIYRWIKCGRDDQFWLPQILQNEPIRGWFYFDGERLVDHHIESIAVSF